MKKIVSILLVTFINILSLFFLFFLLDPGEFVKSAAPILVAYISVLIALINQKREKFDYYLKAKSESSLLKFDLRLINDTSKDFELKSIKISSYPEKVLGDILIPGDRLDKSFEIDTSSIRNIDTSKYLKSNIKVISISNDKSKVISSKVINPYGNIKISWYNKLFK